MAPASVRCCTAARPICRVRRGLPSGGDRFLNPSRIVGQFLGKIVCGDMAAQLELEPVQRHVRFHFRCLKRSAGLLALARITQIAQDRLEPPPPLDGPLPLRQGARLGLHGLERRYRPRLLVGRSA